LVALAVGALALNMVDCNVAQISELNTETKSIELQEADAVRAGIETSSGNLTLRGGANSSLLTQPQPYIRTGLGLFLFSVSAQ